MLEPPEILVSDGVRWEGVTKLAQHAEWDKSCASREAAANESSAQ